MYKTNTLLSNAFHYTINLIFDVALSTFDARGREHEPSSINTLSSHLIGRKKWLQLASIDF